MVDGVRVRALRMLVRVMRRAHLEVSFSQEGEDRILGRYFEDRAFGFYLDVGAFHPIRFSNTLLLYLEGWRGVNVDATPGSMRPFRSLRPRDVNLEVAIGTDPGVVSFYIFKEPALNTFDAELAEQRRARGWEVDHVVQVRQRRLSEVWDEAVPEGMEVDLLTVDVEGRDVDVLSSLDWSRQQPRVVCVEQLAEGAHGRSLLGFLDERGYCLVGRTMNTVLYARQDGRD